MTGKGHLAIGDRMAAFGNGRCEPPAAPAVLSCRLLCVAAVHFGCSEDAESGKATAQRADIAVVEADAAADAPTDAPQPPATAKPCPPTPCPDQNPCTHDYPRPDCTCAHDPLPLACNDNNACTTADFCGPDATCAGLPLPATACADANPCTLDACDPKLGCVHSPADTTTPCDDGNPCTTPDGCKAGACSPGPKLPCDCTTTADCASKEDGNKCNGTLYCDTTAPPFQCKVLPGSVVVCPAGFDTPCTQLKCLDSTGQCAPLGVNEGGPCSDGNACSVGDHCSVGACLPTGVTTCDDGNPCTADGCGLAFGCNHKPVVDGTACEADGSVCTQADACATGSCAAGKPLLCNDGNQCTFDDCSPAVGCVAIFTTASCNDGNACTGGDECYKGLCFGKEVNCDDGNACTVDLCAAGSGCDHVIAPFACSDGNACTVGDACKGGVCTPGPATVTCNDNSVCTVDSCVPAKGCNFAPLPEDTTCTDDVACTSGDACKAGKCVGAAAVWKVEFGLANSDIPRKLLVLPDGYVVVGYSKSFSTVSRAWFVRIDTHGNLLWQKSAGGKTNIEVYSATGVGGGLLVVATVQGDSATASKTWLSKVTGNGDVAWTELGVPCYGHTAGESIIVPAPAGFACISALYGMGMARLDQQAKLLWTGNLGQPADQTRTITAMPGGFVLAGQVPIEQKGGQQLRFVATDDVGKQIWQLTAPVQGSPSVIDSDSGPLGPVFVGSATWIETINIKKFARALQVDAGGKLVWDALYSFAPSWAEAVGVAAGPEGLAVAGVVIASTPPFKATPMLLRTDAAGLERWRALFEINSDGNTVDVAFVDGGITVLGGYDPPGDDKIDGWLAHTDAFGNYSCANSGPCYAMKLADCDDNNPCTYDQCDAAHNGCWNPKQPDSTPCGGGKVCKAGVCQ